MNRMLGTILLVVVVLGSAMGDVHAAMHATNDPGDFAVCATYGNPSAALPDSAPATLYRKPVPN